MALAVCGQATAHKDMTLTLGSGKEASFAQVAWRISDHEGLQGFVRPYGLESHIEASMGLLKGRKLGATSGFLVGGIMPVIRRYGTSHDRESRYFFEAGIGVNLFSGQRVNSATRAGTLFQFGEVLGFGLTLDDKGRVEMGYRLQHFSNGGITNENPGVDLHLLRVKVTLD
jgi:hypothetical protein